MSFLRSVLFIYLLFNFKYNVRPNVLLPLPHWLMTLGLKLVCAEESVYTYYATATLL